VWRDGCIQYLTAFNISSLAWSIKIFLHTCFVEKLEHFIFTCPVLEQFQDLPTICFHATYHLAQALNTCFLQVTEYLQDIVIWLFCQSSRLAQTYTSDVQMVVVINHLSRSLGILEPLAVAPRKDFTAQLIINQTFERWSFSKISCESLSWTENFAS